MPVEPHPMPRTSSADEGLALPMPGGAARAAWRKLAGLGVPAAAAWALVVVHTFAPSAWAQPAAAQPTGLAIFDGADLKLGRQLIDEHACEECHARNAGGDGTAIYRPTGRITTPGSLRGMVEYCNTQLNLGMFPEEVTAVAAVLQRDFYRFK
jgi:hypothetical protein